jgi:hypothetical protein
VLCHVSYLQKPTNDDETLESKEIQARKMEEAKYKNAHNLALGMYDVWSSPTLAAEGKTRAYKGVDITKETKVKIADTAKGLSKRLGSVAFKKKSSKKKNVGITLVDDD